MRYRRRFLLFASFFLVVTGVSVWTMGAEEQAHYVPDYAKEDLAPFLELEGRELTAEDYQLLFFQTGLAKAGIDELYEKGLQKRLAGLQERFFAEVEVECRHTNLLLRSEKIVEKPAPAGVEKKEPGLEKEEPGLESQSTADVEANGVLSRCVEAGSVDFLPVVQDGDILVTFSGHVFGWRSGHAAIVVRALEGRTLEAVAYGCNSAVCSLEHWKEYPCFALLRLKGITSGQQAELAEYALAELADVPYSLFAFTESGAEASPEAEAESGSVPATHCAHLVWSLYRHFGYDLDSDGGAVVTPADIFHSDLLEVVQIYGMDPESITNF